MAELGTASFKIGVDIGDFKNKVEQLKTGFAGAGKKIEAHAESIRKAGMGISVFGAAVTGALGLAVKNASALKEAMGKFEVVFEGQTKKAKGFVKVLVDGYAMSTLEAHKFLAGMQDLLVPMGMAKGAAADMANGIVQLAADLGSFNDLPTEQVMGDMQSALVGSYETMSKYGVVITAATVQTKALNMGLADSKENLTAADKAQAVYAMIVEGSTAAIGDMARTQDGLANVTKDLQAKFSDLVGVIGLKLYPIVTRIIMVFRDGVKAIMAFAEENEVLIRYVTLTVAAIGALAAAIGPILILLPSMVTGIRMVGLALSGINPIFLIITATLMAFTAAWATNFFGIRDIAGNVIDGIGALFDVMKGNMSKFLTGIANTIYTARSYMLKGQRAIMNLLGQDTTELDAQLAIIHGNIVSRNEESKIRQVRTWRSFFDERKALREGFTEQEKEKIDELTDAEVDAASTSAAAHGVAEEKVREFRRMTTDAMIETGNARIEKEKETYSIMEDLEEREVENFQAMMNDKIADALRYSEEMGMSLDEFDAKAFEVYQKIKTGHADSLTEQELRMAEYVGKITGEGGFEQVEKKAGEVSEGVKIDWDRHLTAMATATGNKIMNSELNFKSLGSIVSGVFGDIKNSVVGSFRMILQEYVQGFITNMITATKTNLGGGLSGALSGVFGELFTSIKSSIGGLLGSLSGGVSGLLSSFSSGSSGILSSLASVLPGGAAIAGIAALAPSVISGVSSVVGGIGSAIGGLFGGGSDRATIEEAIETSRNLSAEEQTAADVRRQEDIASDSVESAAGRMGSFDTTATNLTDLSAADAAQAAALAEREIAAQRAAQNAEKNAAADQEYATAAAERTAVRRVAADAEIAAQNAATEAEKARLMGEMFAKQRLAREADKAFNAMVAERKKEEEAAAEQAAWWALSPKERKAAKAAEEQAEKDREYAELSDARDVAMRAAGMSTFARGGNVMQNMFARLHAREMVLPPDLSDFIRRSAKNAAGAAGAVAVNIAAGAVNISGVGNSVLDNTDNLADMISMKLADRVLRRVQVSGA